LIWYGEVAGKGKKSNSCPASNSGCTFATEFATVNLLKLRRKNFDSKFNNFDEAPFAGKSGPFERRGWRGRKADLECRSGRCYVR
jgi:hypothetical protein